MPEPNGTYPQPKDGWVCFHCGERFKKYGAARDHFGEAPGELLQCKALRANLLAVARALKGTAPILTAQARLAGPGGDSEPERVLHCLTEALSREGVRKELEDG